MEGMVGRQRMRATAGYSAADVAADAWGASVGMRTVRVRVL